MTTMQFPATLSLSKLTSTTGVVITCLNGDGSGISASSLGDINGDGFDDLILGGPSTYNYAGAGFVLFGQAGMGSSGTLSISSNTSILTGSDGFVIEAMVLLLQG